MKYVLTSEGLYIESISKDEITITKNRKKAKLFESLDADNHLLFLSLDFNLTFKKERSGSIK